MLETAISEVPSAVVAEENSSNEVWIEALPARVYHTPQYGEVPVTPDKLERMIANFRSNVRGIEIATDFEHGIDTSKGKQASGWYKDFEIRPSSDDPDQLSLFALVNFTDDAKKEVEAGKWRYWSLEWDDEYHTDKGEKVPDVIIGGGLTNRPIAKRTMPINFSEELWEELDEPTQREFAVWTTKYVNSLPNSSFLYVESGADKNKSKRHLPYKDKNGKIDLPHLRNAIARIPQMKGISAELKARLQAKARRLLASATKSMSEGSAVEEAFDLLVKHGFFGEDEYMLELEHKGEEHAEPGTGDPPEPRRDQDGSDDPAIKGGWRRDPLPTPLSDPNIEGVNPKPPKTNVKEGGNTVDGITLSPTQVSQLYSILGITMPDTPGEEFFQPALTAFSEWKTLRDATLAVGEEKEFAEKFPTYWREHQEMLKTNRTNAAIQFSEGVKTVKVPEGDKTVETRQGLSAQAIEKVREVHVKFSEGTATTQDYEEAVAAIMDGGLVTYGEIGSSRENPTLEINTSTLTGLKNARMAFAELVTKVQKENEGISYNDAIVKAAEENPDLAAAYRATQAA